MIYASAAAFALGLLAWDIGRRWIDTQRANDSHYERVKELRKLVYEMREKYGDLGTQLNLRVRELSDRLDDIIDRAIPDAIAEHARQKLNEDERYARRVSERMDKMESSLEHVRTDVVEQEQEIAALQAAPAQPVDVTEFRAELETLRAAFKNFWETIGKQFASKEELASELLKLKSGQAVLAATSGGSRFRAGRNA